MSVVCLLLLCHPSGSPTTPEFPLQIPSALTTMHRPDKSTNMPRYVCAGSMSWRLTGPTGVNRSAVPSPLTDSATALPSPRHPLSHMRCPTQASSAARRHSEHQAKVLPPHNPQLATQKPSQLPDQLPLPGCTTTHYPCTSPHRCFSSPYPSCHPPARMDSSALTGIAAVAHVGGHPATAP